jgi:hypothetical protein
MQLRRIAKRHAQVRRLRDSGLTPAHLIAHMTAIHREAVEPYDTTRRLRFVVRSKCGALH